MIATAIALGALAVAWWVYASGRVEWLTLRERLQPLPRAARNGWYVDQAYSTLFVQPGLAAARFTANVFDTKVVDGLVNGVGAGTRRLAARGPPPPDGLRPLLRARVPPRRRRRPRLAGDAAVNKLLTLTTFLPLHRRPDGARRAVAG